MFYGPKNFLVPHDLFAQDFAVFLVPVLVHTQEYRQQHVYL